MQASQLAPLGSLHRTRTSATSWFPAASSSRRRGVADAPEADNSSRRPRAVASSWESCIWLKDHGSM